MERFVKAAKVTVFGAVCLCMALSISPLFAQPAEENQDEGGGSGGSAWTVTCTYNGFDQLLSPCTSGGNSTCACA